MKKKSLSKGILYVFLITAFILVNFYVSYAQVTVIRGKVTDMEENPLKDVKIKLMDLERGHRFTLTSDKKGNFMRMGIPSSKYQITAELEGFSSFESQIEVEFGQQNIVKIKLEKSVPRLEKNEDFTKGLKFFNNQQYDEAVASFEKVVQEQPDRFEGYYNLGLANLRAGNTDQAILNFNKAIELNPESAESYNALGESYYKKGETEKVVLNMAKVVDLRPEDPIAYFNLGLAYDKMDQTAKAIGSYQEAIKLKPDYSAAYYQAGLASIRLEDYESAVDYFEKFLEVEPNAPEASQVKDLLENLKKK